MAQLERLREAATSDAVDRLIEFLRDEDEDVRAQAASSLGEVGDVRAAPAVTAALADDKGYVVRAAVRALSRLEVLEATEQVIRPLAERLERGLGDGDRLEVEDYASALASILLPDIHDELMADFEDAYVVRGWLAARAVASEAFDWLGEPERAAGVDPRRRAAEIIARDRFTSEEAAEVLAALFDARIPFERDTSHAWPVHAIGARLNEQGGFPLMLEAYERFARLRSEGSPSPALQLERAWQGIGSWMG